MSLGGGGSKSSVILDVLALQADKEAERVRQVRADVTTRKEKVKQIREGRIKRAQIVQGARNAGTATAGTSGVIGATGSVRSTVSENIGTLGQFRNFAETISQLSQKAADLRFFSKDQQRRKDEKAAGLQSIIGIATSVAGIAGAAFTAGGSLFAAAGAGSAGLSSSAAAATGQVGAGGSILGGGSDRRLKKDIVRIGTHPIGIPLYTWTFLWGEKGIGIMADELRKVMPEAIFDVQGYDFVDYNMIGGRT